MCLAKLKTILIPVVLAGAVLLSACQTSRPLPPTAEVTEDVVLPIVEVAQTTPTPVPPTATSTLQLIPSLTPTITPTIAITQEATAVPQVPAFPMPQIGTETHRLDATTLDALDTSGATLMRRNALMWGLVEASEGERNWGQVASLEGDLVQASERGLQVILIVRHTPSWAQKVENSFCGPVKPEKLAAFAAFMRDAVARYSQPPYNVKIWELGNEPDVDSAIMPPEIQFGCMGDPNAAFYGGEYYAEMLKAVYPAMKAADPEAQLMIGGLLLGCDPVNLYKDRPCPSGKFFEGILANGGGGYFDLVGFHAYGAFLAEGNYGDADPVWVPRGGSILGKAGYLREVMAAYGVDKPLVLTETSLICPEWALGCQPVDETFYQAQAEFAVSMLARSWAHGFYGVIWYQFEGVGWRAGSLVGSTPSSPKPAYLAYKFFIEKLAGGTYAGTISEGPDFYGYEFDLGETRIWLMWAVNGAEYTVALPNGYLTATDMYGSPLEPTGMDLPARGPVYIEFSE